MKFSDQLEKRFADLVTHYPIRRSALVPMLLYAQDEVGHVSDEVVHEIAARLDLTDLEVKNVVSYYSMLHTRPIGKYNIQVCTNVSCMLRGAEKVFDCIRQRLGIDHKQDTPDGLFHLEEVECIGACCWGPAMQVNYDFHENLTPEKVDEVLEGLKKNL